MRAGVTQRAPGWLIVLAVSMKTVPWWFRTLAHVLAVVFALCVGLHYKAPEWIVIYALAAIVSAALPSHRKIGFIGLGAGILVGAWGAYLVRDAWRDLSIGDLLSGAGGVLGGGREAVLLVIAGLWLVMGSAFRTQRA